MIRASQRRRETPIPQTDFAGVPSEPFIAQLLSHLVVKPRLQESKKAGLKSGLNRLKKSFQRVDRYRLKKRFRRRLRKDQKHLKGRHPKNRINSRIRRRLLQPKAVAAETRRSPCTNSASRVTTIKEATGSTP